MDFYKVVDNITKEVIIDTYDTNYSLTLYKYKGYVNLLDFIVNSSDKFDIPLDFYFTLNNGLAMFGEIYLKNFQLRPDGMVALSDIVKTKNEIAITKNDLLTIIQSLCKIGINVFSEGYYLWEYIYEIVRSESFEGKPKRQDSFFLFDNINDCNYYKNNIKGHGCICKVEIIEERNFFKGDMNLLDLIPNDSTTKEAKLQIHNYWNENSSKKPIYEYLIEGKCKLMPLK